jgi:hypothetical protein
MAFKISTVSALNDPVVLADLGGRYFVHPVVDLDLEVEYTKSELAASADLQAAITNGWLTAKDENDKPITDVEDHGLGRLLYTSVNVLDRGNWYALTSSTVWEVMGRGILNRDAIKLTDFKAILRVHARVLVFSHKGWVRLYDVTNGVDLGSIEIDGNIVGTSWDWYELDVTENLNIDGIMKLEAQLRVELAYHSIQLSHVILEVRNP